MKPRVNVLSPAVPKVNGWLQNTSIQLLLLLLLVVLTYFPQLGKAEVDLMEARNFIAAREMVQDGHWLVPTLNGEVRIAKPPLPTWLTALAAMAVGDAGDLSALRFPAAVMSGLLVLFLFLLARQLTRDRLMPFLSAVVLASSYGLFNVGREGTWDVYCHSFMLGAIWHLVKALQNKGTAYGVFALCGLLLGCSFLSKGPVAFYAMLLPFLLSYSYCFGRRPFQLNWRGLVMASGIGLLVSIAWPLYILLVAPEALAQNLADESTAWVNRHVRPFWYYWGFWSQTGAWALFTLAALLVPSARKGLAKYAGNYTFLVVWLALAVLLLSVIPEKKERYLLPALIPMALLTGSYVRYLYTSYAKNQGDKWGTRLLAVYTVILLLTACGVPVVVFLLAYQAGLISPALQLSLTAVCLMAGGITILSIVKRRPAFYLLAVCMLNGVVLVHGFPLFEEVKNPSTTYRSFTNLQGNPEISGYPMYAVGGLPIVHQWEAGGLVDTLRFRNHKLQVPAQLPAILFSPVTLTPGDLANSAVKLGKLDTYHPNPKNHAEVYHVYLLGGD
ncbi:ArnT family glycosyltransferase [Pontibacter sp. CAU 1760]